MRRVKTLNENMTDFFILGNINELTMIFIFFCKFVVFKEQKSVCIYKKLNVSYIKIYLI